MLYELYIAGQLCDLDDDISIALSYTSIDTDQPTAEHGSYSKSVELKGTEKNNAIFGQLFIPSRNILGDDPSAGGVYFDPRKRTDYVLWYNGDIIDKGYLKVDNVNNINGDITYSITLYSDLGDFFYNLMYNQSTGEEITLGDLYYGFKDISGNTIDENDGTLLYWDKDFVEESWNALSAGTTDMRVQNHIVAAPTYGGYYDDFDNNKVLVNYGSLGDGSAKQLLQPVFNSDPATRSGYTDYRGWILTEATRDLDEWEVRDLRSVYQRPAIKLSTILDAISNPENNGGYEVNWDEDIKNSPYYRKSYLLLNRLNFDLDANANSISGLGTQLPVVTCSNGVFQDGKLWDAANSASTIFNLSGYTYPHVTISMENYFTNMSAFDQVTSGKTLYTSYWCQYHAGEDLDHHRAWVYGGMAVRVSAYSGDTMKAQTPVYLYTTPVYNSNKPFGYGVDNWKWLMANQLQVEEGDIVVRENSIIWDNERGQNKWAMPIEIDLNLPSEDNLTLYLQIAWVWVASRSDAGVGIAFQTSSADKGYMSRPYWNAIVVLLNDDENSTGIYDGTINPNVQKTNVTKQILFGESESPYTYLVGFTRMMGAKFKYDLAAKKIYILSRNHYYLPEVEIIDEYIDRSQDYEITPTLSEYKWYEYGFETPETYAAQLYNRKNKIEYGKKKVDTGYYFNNDSNNLFEDIPYTNGIPYLQQSIYYSIVENVPSILVSPTLDVSIFKQSGDTVEDESIKIKGYSSYYTVNILPDASGNKICCFDADNEPVEDLTDCLVFFDGMREMLDDYQISDNIPIMNTLNEKPCFMFVSGQTPVYAEKDAEAAVQVCKKVRNIPVFSKYLTNAEGVYTNSLDFSKPAYTFIGNGEKYGDDIALYDKYWKAFISDLYERNAKAVTCWVFLREKPEQAMRKFYYFDNSIWAIAEVTDYDASSDDPTQVKFVKVYDISNYTDGEVDWGYDDDEKPRPVPPVPSGETSYTFQWEYPQYEPSPKILVFEPTSGGTFPRSGGTNIIYQTFESSREYGGQKTYHIPYTISNNTGGIVNAIESGQTGNMEYVNVSVTANPTAEIRDGSINFTQSDSGEIMRLDLYQSAGSGSTSGDTSGGTMIVENLYRTPYSYYHFVESGAAGVPKEEDDYLPDYRPEAVYYGSGITSVTYYHPSRLKKAVFSPTVRVINKSFNAYNVAYMTEIWSFSPIAPILSGTCFTSAASAGTLYYPTGADYSTWIAALPSGWTFEEISEPWSSGGTMSYYDVNDIQHTISFLDGIIPSVVFDFDSISDGDGYHYGIGRQKPIRDVTMSGITFISVSAFTNNYVYPIIDLTLPDGLLSVSLPDVTSMGNPTLTIPDSVKVLKVRGIMNNYTNMIIGSGVKKMTTKDIYLFHVEGSNYWVEGRQLICKSPTMEVVNGGNKLTQNGTGTLYYPCGSDYSSMISNLGSGWTYECYSGTPIITDKVVLTLTGGTKQTDTVANGTIGFREYANRSDIAGVELYGVTDIDDSAFEGCSNLSYVKGTDSLRSIGDRAFAYCNLSGVSPTINDAVNSIGVSPFIGNKLTGYRVVPNNTYSGGTYLIDVVSGTLICSCGAKGDVSIPSSVTIIGESAFYDDKSLIGNLSDGPFVIPNTIVEIKDYAFGGAFCNGSSNYISIEANSSLTIGNYAFENCTELNRIRCLSSVAPTLGNNVFDNIKSNGELIVSKGVDYSSWLSALPSGWSITYI